jgi:hypothetical protein
MWEGRAACRHGGGTRVAAGFDAQQSAGFPVKTPDLAR